MCIDHTSSKPHSLHQTAAEAQVVDKTEGLSLHGQIEGSTDSEEYLTPLSLFSDEVSHHVDHQN